MTDAAWIYIKETVAEVKMVPVWTSDGVVTVCPKDALFNADGAHEHTPGCVVLASVDNHMHVGSVLRHLGVCEVRS